MADDIISDSFEWHSSDAPTQAAMADLHFQNIYGKDKDYLKSSPEKQALIRQAYNDVLSDNAATSAYNPNNVVAAEKQATADTAGPLDNFFTKVKDSFVDGANRFRFVNDVANPDGVVDKNFSKVAAAHYAKQSQRIVTAEEKALAKDLVARQKQWDQGGFLNKAAATIGFLGYDVLSNPIGAAHLFADSSSSMATMTISAKAGAVTGGAATGLAGAAVGSVVPVAGTAIGGTAGVAVGSAVGGAAGMFTGEAADAMTSKFLELVDDKLKTLKLPPTESNIDMIMKDQAWVKDSQIKSIKYGTALAGADTVIGAAVGRIATSPVKAALRTAKEIVKDMDHVAITTLASQSGKSAAQVTETLVQREAKVILDARTFKANLTGKAASTAAEIGSEPLTEAIGTAASGDKNTFTNLMNETVGGIAGGPIGVAVDKAVFGSKLAGDTTKDFVKNIISATPESKAMAQTQKETLKTVQKQGVTQADAGYKAEVASIEHTDAAHAEISDPTNLKYNAIKAVDILTKYDTPDAYNKAVEIEAYERKAWTANKARLQELADKQDAGETLTEAENQEASGLLKVVEAQNNNILKINGFVDTIYNNVQATKTKQRDNTTVNPTTSTQQEIVDSISFGSSPHKNASTVADIDTMLKRTDLDSDVKTLLKEQKAASIIRSQIEQKATKPNTSNKTISDVSNDIYHGIKNSDFKGIDAYVQGITHFLNPQVNNVIKAAAELAGLKKFRDAHVAKAEMVQAVYDSVVNKTPLSPKHQQAYADAQAKAKLQGKAFIIDQRSGMGSNPLIANIKQEAEALNIEVKKAETLYKVLSKPANTSTGTTTQTAPTATPAKPTTAPAVVSTAPAAKPVVKSKPTTATTQKPTPTHTLESAKAILDSGGSVTFLSAGHPDLKGDNIKGQFDLQRQLHTAGYVNAVDPINKTRTFKESHAQETTRKSKTTTAASKPFPTQSEVMLQEEIDAMIADGLVPGTAPFDNAVERRKREYYELDPVTEAGIVAHFEKVLARAWDVFKTGSTNFVYAEMDIAAVGGANALFGTSGFDTHFKAIVGIIKAELAKAAPHAQLYRKGGDEFGVIAPDMTADQIDEILAIAQEKILEYAAAHGAVDEKTGKYTTMAELINPKPNRHNGVRLVYSVRDFTGNSSIAELRSAVDREVELRKKKDPNYKEGEDNGNISETETTGTVASGTQAKRTGRSPAVTTAGVSEQDGKETFGTTKAGFKPKSKLVDGSFIDTTGKVNSVKGRHISFNGLPEMTLMIHRTNGLGYSVFDLATGRRLSDYSSTQAEAIADATEKLQTAGKEKVIFAINKARVEMGFDPIPYVKDITSEAPIASVDAPTTEVDTNTAVDEVVTPTESIKPSTAESNSDSVPDNLAAYDRLDSIEIQVGVDDQGNPIMMSYEEAMADIESQIKEAQDILKCTQG